MASLLDLAEARLRGLLDVQRQPRPSMVGLLGGKEPQGTLASTISGYTPPQMQAMSNQQVMDYARNVASSARQNLQNQMSDIDRALVMDQGGINVGDRQALARLMEQIPGLMGAVAYHGTPHTIRGKFDISKVGTGEGAQAYGHGMYFAENPAVAQAYSKIMPTGGPQPSPIRTIFGKEVEPMTPEYKAAQLVDEMGLSKAKKFVNEWAKDPIPSQVDYVQAVQNSLLGITKKSDVKNLGTGNLYKVDIPDEYIPNMLDWDKPLSKMTKKEAAIIEPLKNKLIAEKNPYHPDSFETIGQVIQFSRGANPNLEKQLLEAGIPGIKYLDEGSRDVSQNYVVNLPGFGSYDFATLKEAKDFIKQNPQEKFELIKPKKTTSNFVVFDPSEVKILEKNKKKIEGLLD